MSAIHFARVLPAHKSRPALAVARCSAIEGLTTSTHWHAVTCQRCLARRPADEPLPPPAPGIPEWLALATDDDQGDYERDRAIDDALTGDA